MVENIKSQMRKGILEYCILTIIGRKEVYTSDNMPNMAADARAIIYGDLSGLAVKVTENWEINILREKYATQHALGVFAYLEMDSKIENAQKLTALKMKNS